MTVRRLGPGDHAEAAAALAHFNAAPAGAVPSFLADPAVLLLVAFEAGEPVGRLYAYELRHPQGGCDLLLYEVDVVAAARRRGHGRALVAALLAEARARACREVWVLTEPDNEAALALYEGAGAVRDPDAALLTWRMTE